VSNYTTSVRAIATTTAETTATLKVASTKRTIRTENVQIVHSE
jgi:hypothetical protein